MLEKLSFRKINWVPLWYRLSSDA